MTELPVLSPVDQRILGCLLEKERTVPASYPMTRTALRAACNQTSSRDPVVSYDDELVEQACRGLKNRELLRIVWADRGPRTLKYHQRLAELLAPADDERAVLTVLLLRGPQAAGELRARTERLHPFADRADVEACLNRMAQASPPLVRELPRTAGERDPRWVHLLGDPASDDGASEHEPPPVEIDLTTRDERVRATYDAIATPYAAKITGELDDLPFERWLLDRVVDLAGSSPVVEVGCGPGHTTAYLAGSGADATGIDLSPAMVEEARRRFPNGRYQVGDLRDLLRPAADGWGAVLAWYSLVHTTPTEMPDVVARLARPLRPGGWLVYAGHAGAEVRHFDALFDREVDVDFVLQEPTKVAAAFEATGLVDVEWYRRGPVRDETTERAYVLGRLPR